VILYLSASEESMGCLLAKESEGAERALKSTDSFIPVVSPPVLDIIPWLWSGLEEKEVHTFLSLRVTFEKSVLIVEAWVVVLQR